MAATRALFCVDILDIVLGYLSPGPTPHDDECRFRVAERRRAQQSLAFIARVCTAFSDSALDVLWTAVDDAAHILSILPIHRGSSHGDDTQVSNLVTSSFMYAYNQSAAAQITSCELTKDQWLRIRKYTSRVKALRMGETAIPPMVWENLLSWCQDGPLFPRLVRLDQYRVDLDFSHKESLLLSPMLVHLSLQIRTGAPETALHEVRRTLTRLTSLSITQGTKSEYHTEASERIAFWEIDCLDTLSIDHRLVLTPPMLHSLATFQNLHTLSFCFSLWSTDDSQFKCAGFPALRHLNLTAAMDHATRFLVAVSPLPRLETLAVCSERFAEPCPRRIRRTLCTLHSTLPSSIHRVYLTFTRATGEPDPRLDLADLLAPLRRLRGLREVALRCKRMSVFFCDDDILSSTAAWPALEDLELDIAQAGRDTGMMGVIPKKESVDAVTRCSVGGYCVADAHSIARLHSCMCRTAAPNLRPLE